MAAFEPLINLLVLLSALSVASERLANAMKLGDTDLREKKGSPQEEKARVMSGALGVRVYPPVSAFISGPALARTVSHDYIS